MPSENTLPVYRLLLHVSCKTLMVNELLNHTHSHFDSLSKNTLDSIVAMSLEVDYHSYSMQSLFYRYSESF